MWASDVTFAKCLSTLSTLSTHSFVLRRLCCARIHFACIYVQTKRCYVQTKRTFRMRLRRHLRHLAVPQLPTFLASNDMAVTHVNQDKTKIVKATNAYNAYANLWPIYECGFSIKVIWSIMQALLVRICSVGKHVLAHGVWLVELVNVCGEFPGKSRTG